MHSENTDEEGKVKKNKDVDIQTEKCKCVWYGLTLIYAFNILAHNFPYNLYAGYVSLHIIFMSE